MGFFGAPLMLWGALAAGIPIALHFFFRSRYRTIPWAAMKFLLLSIEQTSRRLRFQELLLLMMRVAVIVLLALALARPLFWSGGGAGGGDSVDAVFVFDTSLSMDVREGDETRLDKAKKAAIDVMDHLPSGSTVQIVTCADRSSIFEEHRPTDLVQARKLIQNLRITHLSTDLAEGLRQAASMLDDMQASNKEFYLFSDMQQIGWEKQAQTTTKLMRDIAEKTNVVLVRCGTKSLRNDLRNVAVVDISPQSGVPRPGQRIGFSVLLHNTGQKPVEDLVVTLMVDQDKKSIDTRAVPVLQPGQKRAITLTGKIAKPGLRLLTAQVKSDDLEADNRFDQVLLVREQVNILVVDGSPDNDDPENSATFHLLHALAPVSDDKRGEYFLQPTVVSPEFATPAQLETHDLCILANTAVQPIPGKPGSWLTGTFVKALDKYVRDGHGVIVFGGDRVEPQPYNKILGEKYGLLPLPLAEVKQPETSDFTKAPLHLNRNSVQLASLRPFREDDYFKSLNNVEIYRALMVQEPLASMKNPESQAKRQQTTRVVMRYSNDWPAIVSKKLGSGEVMFVTTAAHPQFSKAGPTWTNWPLMPEYVPFVNLMVSHLLQQQTQNHNFNAGESLIWNSQIKEKKAFSLFHPSGKEERLGLPESRDERKLIKAENLVHAGFYTLKTQPPPGIAIQQDEEPEKEITIPLAVAPDLSESQNLNVLSDGDLKKQLNIRAEYVTAGVSDEAFSQINRVNREWTLWLLGGVLLLAVGEMFFAWWCGKAW